MAEFNGFKSFLRSVYMIKRRFEPRTVNVNIPAKEKKNPIILTLLPILTPLITILLLVLIMNVINSGSGIGSYMFMFIMMISSAIIGLVTYVITNKYKKKAMQENMVEWEKSLDQIGQDTLTEFQSRYAYINKCYVSDYGSLLNSVLNTDAYLWNVSSDHYDYLSAELGRADIPSDVIINVGGKPTDLEPRLQKKLEDYRGRCSLYKAAPFCTDLSECGNLGVFGAQRQSFLIPFIMKLCVRHGYDMLKCMLVCSNDNYINYQWMRWLPHMWDNDYCDRYIRLSSRRQAYFESLLKTEAEKAQDGYYVPFYVFIIEEEMSIFGTSLITRMKELVKLEHAYIIVMSEKENGIPNFCKGKINASTTNMTFESQDFENKMGFTATPVSSMQAEKLTRYMSRVHLVDSNSGSRIPSVIGFNEMLGKDYSIRENIAENWRNATNPSDINCMLGVVEDAAPLLVPVDKLKHAILAGKTGSGKSQFLMSFITHLMVTYPASFVQFLFIDFKGNALANNFKRTPHCSGSFSNLDHGDDSQINRIREMLNAEIKRREKIINESTAKVNDIKHYNLTAEVRSTRNFMPHLFVVVDEYVELLSQHSEFIQDFESFCRVGRSIGIHLILASQRLDGKVSDQIKANVDLFICFKVNDAEECKSVIKCSGAEAIKVKGRGFARLENDVIEFQAAWIEKPYIPFAMNEKGVFYEVRPDGRRGEFNKKDSYEDDRTELNVISYALGALNDGRQGKIFSEQLADAYYWNANQVALTQHMRGKTNKIIAMVGTSDDFYAHKHSPAVLNLTGNNYAIAGGMKRGKTTLLQSIIFSACQISSADTVNFYICELYGKSFKPFEALPQVHDTIIDNSEQFFRLLMMLESELKVRKGILGDSYNSVEEYNNQALRENRISNIIIVIDDIDNLIEDYSVVEEKIEALISGGVAKYGITFIVSLTRYTDLRRFLRSFENRIVMHYNDDASEELMNAPRTVNLQNVPGRCFVENNGRILQTQILGFFTPPGQTLRSSITDLIDSYISTLKSEERVCNVKPVIRRVECPDLVSMLPLSVNNGDLIPMFMDNVSNSPVFLNSRVLNSLMIFGEYEIGQRYLLNIIDTLAHTNAELHIIDLSHELGLNSDFEHGMFVYDADDINLLLANAGMREDENIPRVYITYALSELQSKLDALRPGVFDSIDKILEDVYNNGGRNNQFWLSVDASHSNFLNDRSNSLNYSRCGRAVVLSPRYITIGEAMNFGRNVPCLLDIDYNDCDLPAGQAWLCLRNSFRRVVLPMG